MGRIWGELSRAHARGLLLRMHEVLRNHVAGPFGFRSPVAVGMNIDIASIDIVSEVNMVSIKVYSCVSTDLHLGTGRRKDPASEGGVCMSMCMKWDAALFLRF